MEPQSLRIRLLGGFELVRGGQRLPPFDSARAEALLAYLLLHRESPQPRQHVSFVLWPDSTESQARTNLRHVLHHLRRVLPVADELLEITPRTIQWQPAAATWLDVDAFEEALIRADAGDQEPVTALQDAVALYRGDLLAGSYEEWVVEKRDWLRRSYLAALTRLVVLLEAGGELDEAILHAERHLALDPLDEEVYRVLMRLHVARGDRGRALRVYHAGVATLEREIGVKPSAALREAYEALLPPEQVTGSDAQAGERLGGSTLVGRLAEWDRLTGFWREAERGRLQLVLVSGEPGVGKTRLVEEFREWCVHRGVSTVEARSYAAEGALPYRPVAAWLRSEPLWRVVIQLDRAYLTELARLLPELLVEFPNLPRPEPLPEPDQRQRLFDAIARVVQGYGRPLLMIAEDLQWCDRETLQVMHFLLRSEHYSPLLMVATARREDLDAPHPLFELVTGMQALDRFAEVQLDRLSQGQTAALAARITGHPVSEPEAGRLYAESEGNPLFVVEALRAGWHAGRYEPGSLTPRLQFTIEARLAQLSQPARELVGIAATIGRSFGTDILAAATHSDASDLVRSLDELWRRRIIREQDTDAYDFSHDKIREVAYAALSPPRRRDAHLRVARALEHLNREDPGTVSGLLAAHFDQAGAADEAVTWYIRAARESQRLHANLEVIRLLDRAQAILESLPATTDRRQLRLEALTALSSALGWVEGWSSERLETVHRQALALATSLGVEPEAPLLRTMAITSLARRDFEAAQGFGQRLAALAGSGQDDMLLVEAAYVLGILAFWRGQFISARDHFETAVSRYRPEQRSAHLLRYVMDPQVVCMSRLANTLWFLGCPVAAVRTRDAALALAAEVGHSYSSSTALMFSALLSLDMRDWASVRKYWSMLATGFHDFDTRPTKLGATAIAGFLDVLDGESEQGLARIRRTLGEAQEFDHAPGTRACLRRVLIEACVVSGAADAGLAAADEFLASDDPARLWEAEIHRLRAEFLADLGAGPETVEAAIRRSLEVSRRQGAAMLELRAATNLLRFQTAGGSARATQEARALLRSVIDGLPERHDRPDLVEAVALLRQE